jgi:TPR repeat protein
MKKIVINTPLTAGQAYNNGNYKEAAKWFRKAAEQGDAEVQLILVSMYNEGQGVR